MRRWAAVAAAAGFLLTAATPPISAQGKGTPGHCPDGNGVTVVIDFQDLGGSTIVRCARGDQATGHAALRNAGISITGTNRWGEGFICRIEGKPAPSAEPCIDTPPATAYWSYWHAPNGGAWKYSDFGVMNRKPPLGSYEGWSFSKNRTATTNPQPRVKPQRPVAAPPPPPPPPPPKPQPQPQPQPGPGAPPPPPPPVTTAPPSSTTTEVPPSTTVAPPAATTSETPAWTGVTPTSSASESSSATGTIIGIGAVLAVVVGAIVATARRRRAGDSS
ncbi:hypothetical protein [Allokutzneria sp. NRRL B-24872]|uniref:hypothetical protein n=1 Tax=Allokutzneria sp. NRRL B-24872 TaxID=1137961 RepID=UPI00143D0A9B|nr:hypothetical protein [Allokutzneria sp. NRRL B-24872]